MMGKMDPVTTHSVLCQEWWTKVSQIYIPMRKLLQTLMAPTEQNLKDSLRAGIATGIAVATLLKVINAKGQSTDKGWLPMIKVDLTQELSAEGQGGYHPFWIVPKIVERVK